MIGTYGEPDELLSRLSREKVEPLWTVMHSMVKPQPAPKAEVSLWKYEQLRPLLLQAGKQVSSDEAERRVLMLVNPALKAPFTTDTLYAGLQLINPGETAPAHRHQAFALRFIIEGNRGWTAVHGEKIFMEAGDVILTPQWQWHDHGHDGDGPMIWLDGLDLPLYHQLPTHFAEPYWEPRYPSKEISESPLRFPWVDMKAKLDKKQGDSSIETYLNQDGKYISDTLGAQAAKVKTGCKSTFVRDTCSYIVHIISGKGETTIKLSDGTETTVKWSKSDTFCLPAWSKATHTSEGTDDAYFFMLTDRPLLDNLNMYISDKESHV